MLDPTPVLHAAWDTDFVEHSLGGKNEKLVAHELLLKFSSRKTDWQTGTVLAWMDESHQLAKTVAYGRIARFTCGADLKRMRISLDQNYTDEATTVVEEQLAKAGYRLAHVLNLSFKNRGHASQPATNARVEQTLTLAVV